MLSNGGEGDQSTITYSEISTVFPLSNMTAEEKDKNIAMVLRLYLRILWRKCTLLKKRCVFQNDEPSQLARYSFTRANVTVLRLLRRHLPEKMFTKSSSFSRADYASVHDSLLALYHGVRLHHRNTASCQWAGHDYIVPTLHKVPLTHLQGARLHSSIFDYKKICSR